MEKKEKVKEIKTNFSIVVFFYTLIQLSVSKLEGSSSLRSSEICDEKIY